MVKHEKKRGFVAVLAVFFIMLFSFPAFIMAAATVSNVTISPSTVSPGGTVTVDFNYTIASGSNLAWAVLFRPSAYTTMNTAWGGTSGQDFLVYGGTINNLCSGCGGQVGTYNSGVASSGSISTYANVALTVPSGYDGTYSCIVIVREANNIYVNSFDAQAYTSFTVSSSPIEAAKSASALSVCVGDIVTFCITATNTGSSAHTFNIWDTVPSGLTYSGCDNSCTQSGGVVSWTVTSLAASGAATRCYWASVNALPFYEFNRVMFAWVTGRDYSVYKYKDMAAYGDSKYVFSDSVLKN